MAFTVSQSILNASWVHLYVYLHMIKQSDQPEYILMQGVKGLRQTRVSVAKSQMLRFVVQDPESIIIFK